MSNLPDDLGPRLRKSLNRGSAPDLAPEVLSGAADRTPPKLANPRRTLQVTGGATVLVAAVAVAALVIGPTLNRAPLFTVASASASNTAHGSADANVPSVHGLMRIWANYVYHAGPGLATSGGNGNVYQLIRSGSGAGRIDALASIFGLGGAQVTKDDSDKANPTYTIGTIDGSTPALYLTWSGTGDWSYSDLDATPNDLCGLTDGSGGSSNSGSGSGSGASSSAPSTPAPGTPAPDATCRANPPAGPNDAPTGDTARADAQKLFSETGLNVSQADIQLQSDSTQTTATANLEVGGVKTALGWGVTWSSTGKIASAYGSSISVDDRGSYGTISAADAVSRLTDSRWSGEAGPKYSGGIRPFAMLNSDVGTTVGSAPAPTPLPISSPAPYTDPSGAPTAAPGVAPDPAPTTMPGANVPPTDLPTPNPVPTGPPTINVTVNTAEPTLLLMWDSNGNGWLVPGYAMKVENGFWNSVVSLVPGVIELPPLPTVEPDDIAPTTGN